MDLGSWPVKHLKAHAQIKTTMPQDDHSLQTLEATQEGLQNDKATRKHPTLIANTLLPKTQATETLQTG